MLIILVIIVLIIAILVLSIKYYKTYARLHSSKIFDEAAKREMGKIRYEDHHITCDYCGASIDTSQDHVCPQCGAGYGNDKEWINRFKINQDWVNQQAEAEARKEINKAEAEAHKIGRKIRRLIILLVVIVVGLAAFVLFGIHLGKVGEYAKSEELNKYSFENYEEADYDVVGDGVLLNQGGILIEIKGIYYDKDNDSVKIGYHFCNNNNFDCKISMDGLAVNRYAHNFVFFYETFAKNSDVVFYKEVRNISKIESLIYGDFCVRNLDYDTIYDSDECVKVETTINENTEPILSDGTVLFDNSSITIVGTGYNEDGEYTFEILNKTDEVLKMECRDGKFKGRAIDVYGYNMVTIPGKCVSDQNYIYFHDEEFENREKTDYVSVNFEFSDDSRPEFNFSTGYIELK